LLEAIDRGKYPGGRLGRTSPFLPPLCFDCDIDGTKSFFGWSSIRRLSRSARRPVRRTKRHFLSKLARQRRHHHQQQFAPVSSLPTTIRLHLLSPTASHSNNNTSQTRTGAGAATGKGGFIRRCARTRRLPTPSLAPRFSTASKSTNDGAVTTRAVAAETRSIVYASLRCPTEALIPRIGRIGTRHARYQPAGHGSPPVRMDSQAKYAALVRGERRAGVYLRLPRRDANYQEKIWVRPVAGSFFFVPFFLVASPPLFFVNVSELTTVSSRYAGYCRITRRDLYSFKRLEGSSRIRKVARSARILVLWR
jgi:hypothetical protein